MADSIAKSMPVMVRSLRATRASVPVVTLIWMVMATNTNNNNSDNNKAAPRREGSETARWRGSFMERSSL